MENQVDTLIRINDMMKKPSSLSDKVIECNLNMNVSVSNIKRSCIFQWIQSLLIVIFTVTFFILYFQFRKEVHVLEAQMNSINSNLAILILKNERLHRILNKPNLRQQSMKKLRPYDNKELSHYNFSSATRLNNNITLGGVNESGENKKNTINDRVIRSIATFEGNNNTEKMMEFNKTNNIEKNHSMIWCDSRAGRLRRDDGRGKHRRKSNRRLKRSRRRLGTRGPLLLY